MINPSIKGTPKKIFLQVGPNVDSEIEFKQCSEITWCEDRVYETDIEYIRNDLYGKEDR